MEEGDGRIEVLLVPTESVRDYLPYCREWLKRAANVSWNGMPYSHAKEGVLSGEMQLWVIGSEFAWVAAAVTYIYRPFTVRLCKILLAGGRGADLWLPEFIETVERFAALNKCGAIEVFGRPGWRKLARRTGFRHECSVFIKRI